MILNENRLFVVLCVYPHKNQCGVELKIILSIGNDEEPENISEKQISFYRNLTCKS